MFDPSHCPPVPAWAVVSTERAVESALEAVGGSTGEVVVRHEQRRSRQKV